MKKKLLIFICCCWAIVFGLSVFSSNLGSGLIALGFDESSMVIFKWIYGLAVLFGAGIPFGIWVKSISDWYETMIDDSAIYGKNDD